MTRSVSSKTSASSVFAAVSAPTIVVEKRVCLARKSRDAQVDGKIGSTPRFTRDVIKGDLALL